MKFVIQVLLVLCMSSVAVREVHAQSDKQQDKQLYERPLVIVVPSYKNEEWCIKNLDSIFMQKYSNFRVIYIIDDCTIDATVSRVQEYITAHNLQDKITLIANPTRRGALANHIEAVHRCKDWEIVVQLDADDWFAHDQVLARINSAYTDPAVWLTYGQHEVYPKGKKGQCRAVPKTVLRLAAYREYAWITSALRTFYAGLFKQIKLEDFIDQGEFFSTSCDFAFMIPMLEMAQGKIKFIDEILYIYNCATPLNDYKKNLQQQLHNEYVIRARPKYKPLERLEFNNQEQRTSSALIIFSKNPSFLKTLLESASRKLSHCDKVIVVAQASNDAVMRLYQELEREFPSVALIYVQRESCKQQVLEALYGCAQEYIAVVHDRCIISHDIDLAECVYWLKRTHAHGFYLARGKDCIAHPLLERSVKNPPLVKLAPGICAWQFKQGEYDWACAYTYDMALYKKQLLIDTLGSLKASSLEQLLQGWRLQYHTPDAVGLCFDYAKVSVS